MRGYRLTGSNPKWQSVELQEPVPARGEIIVDIAAASLNYRDILVASSGALCVPLSDGAGRVSSVAQDVTGVRPGDRVVVGFMPGWLDGSFTEVRQSTALGGGTVDGVLVERIAVPALSAVHIPDSMSFEEAACLPCAGVTAWAALLERRVLLPGETVLLLGTGGVSIFALQLAKQAGARVIITSSSDEKLERAKGLGADETINYKRVPEWADHVLSLTGGIGADLAVDVAGPATLNETLRATRHDGRISLMGVLTGVSGDIDTALLLRKRITLQGVYVGPVSMLRQLIKVGITPVVDRVFSFEETEVAYGAIAQASHFGKLLIRVAPSD